MGGKRVFQKIEKISFNIMKGITVFCLFGLIVLVTIQVLSRFLPSLLKPVPDDVLNLFDVWMIFLGTALLLRNYEHIRVELLDTMLRNKDRIRKFLNLTIQILILMFLMFMTKSGVELYRASLTRLTPMLLLPQRWWYLPLPLSSILMIFYTIVRMLRIIISIIRKKEG